MIVITLKISILNFLSLTEDNFNIYFYIRFSIYLDTFLIIDSSKKKTLNYHFYEIYLLAFESYFDFKIIMSGIGDSNYVWIFRINVRISDCVCPKDLVNGLTSYYTMFMKI